MGQIDISVILCTYNRAASLLSTLASLACLRMPPDVKWELLVVDNNSKDETRDVVDEFAKTADICVQYLFEGQQGKSAALNTGLSAAKGKIIAFTDDDVVADPDWLLFLTRAFAEYDCAAVAGKIVPVWNHPKPEWLEMEGQQAVLNFDLGVEEKQIDCPPFGANSAFRKETFQKYGVFRLDLGPNGKDRVLSEDTEFANRLIAAGEKVWYVPEAIIYHPVDPRRASKSFFLQFFYNDGRAAMRTLDCPKDTVRYWGVPRWIFRPLTRNFLAWMLSVSARPRFRYKCRTYADLGKVAEAWALSRRAANAKKTRKVRPTAERAEL